MIDPDKKYRTKDGRDVRIYAVDGEAVYTVHGAVAHNGEWRIASWRPDGRYYIDKEVGLDLIEVRTAEAVVLSALRSLFFSIEVQGRVVSLTCQALRDSGHLREGE